MSNLNNLSNDDLITQTKNASQKEKTATLELLKYLHEVELRRLYARLYYPSLFSFIVSELKYSESEASTRVNAMRFMYSMAEAKEAIQSNKLSLTTASQLQRFFRQEKRTLTEKKEILKQCENQSKSKIEKILLKISPKQVEIKETKKQVTSDLTEIKFHIDQKIEEKIKRVKDLKGHLPLKEIFSNALDAYIRAIEIPGKQTKTVSFPKKSNLSSKSRYYPVALKNLVRERSKNQCEYVDPKTKKRCRSTYRLQFEHKVPYAHGGLTKPENILHFCQAHNQLAAIDRFGKLKMDRYFNKTITQV